MLKFFALLAASAFAAEPVIVAAPKPVLFVPASSYVANVRFTAPVAPAAAARIDQQFRFDPQSRLWVPRSLTESTAFKPAASVLSSDSAPELFASAASEDFGVLFARSKNGESARPTPPPPSPYSDAQIVDMATQLAKSYKGSPWSYTEYNSVLYPTLDNLRQQGVPQRQLELFKKTCDDHPGRPFNPWSGD